LVLLKVSFLGLRAVSKVRWLGLRLAVAVALTASPLLMTAPATAQVQWNLPSAYPVDNFHSQNLEAFAKDVAHVTDGKLAIRVHPNASLYPASAIKSVVRIGQVQIGETLISLHESEVVGRVKTDDRTQFRSAGVDRVICCTMAATGHVCQTAD
jgi:hypothetical protein